MDQLAKFSPYLLKVVLMLLGLYCFRFILRLWRNLGGRP